MASLLYGAGLRLLDCCRLRVKDVDFHRRELTVRDGKGRKDRVTMLPEKLRAPLAAHLDRVRKQHEADLGQGAGSVELPYALGVKYPHAAWEWGWQWVFPATRLYLDAETRQRRRHHLHESVLQRAIKDAVRLAGIPKPATSHSLALICHASPGEGLRHPNDTGASRRQGCQHHHDLLCAAESYVELLR